MMFSQAPFWQIFGFCAHSFISVNVIELRTDLPEFLPGQEMHLTDASVGHSRAVRAKFLILRASENRARPARSAPAESLENSPGATATGFGHGIRHGIRALSIANLRVAKVPAVIDAGSSVRSEIEPV